MQQTETFARFIRLMQSFGAFQNTDLQNFTLLDENGEVHPNSDELKQLQRTILDASKRVKEITGVDIF